MFRGLIVCYRAAVAAVARIPETPEIKEGVQHIAGSCNAKLVHSLPQEDPAGIYIYADLSSRALLVSCRNYNNTTYITSTLTLYRPTECIVREDYYICLPTTKWQMHDSFCPYCQTRSWQEFSLVWCTPLGFWCALCPHWSASLATKLAHPGPSLVYRVNDIHKQDPF